MLKIVSLFLIFMVVLAMFGKLRLPRIGGRNARGGLPKPRLCPECGRYNLRGGPCRDCSNGQG